MTVWPPYRVSFFGLPIICSSLLMLKIDTFVHLCQHSEATLEFVEDIFSDIKIIDHKGIWIKLLVKTFISKAVDRLCRQLLECGSLPHIAEHELLIEVDEETLVLKNVKVCGLCPL